MLALCVYQFETIFDHAVSGHRCCCIMASEGVTLEMLKIKLWLRHGHT